ncbi:hypothetical protein DFH07DRAFT_772821 [Mycena maculata]|uniref:Uncharacterized protein n=1 Tax=Mycena maculata TaxID=230809 RepID=A0AAD7NEI4_9AGAR|nr:hypothetical protein DFH07DRAFT_772821 [Mycena maculata]
MEVFPDPSELVDLTSLKQSSKPPGDQLELPPSKTQTFHWWIYVPLKVRWRAGAASIYPSRRVTAASLPRECAAPGEARAIPGLRSRHHSAVENGLPQDTNLLIRYSWFSVRATVLDPMRSRNLMRPGSHPIPSAMSEPGAQTSKQELSLDPLGFYRPFASSGCDDWLPRMMSAVKMMAVAAEFIPLPYISASFSAVVLLLETVDRMKRNRGDLKELCATVTGIILILQHELSAHGQNAAIRFVGLCESFFALLQSMRESLENLLKSRRGIRGRLAAVIGATNVAQQIESFRTRVHELRSNFILLATIGTHINVADIQNNYADMNMQHAHSTSTSQAGEALILDQFRNVALGEINLLYEIPVRNALYKIKIFTARISGESQALTVAKYEDEDEAKLIPLAVYRKLHRPSSDLVWASIEGMLFKQFKDSEKYHIWRLNNFRGVLFSPVFYVDADQSQTSTIFVRREPIHLCLTMPDEKWSSSSDEVNNNLSRWYSGFYKFQPSESAIAPIIASCDYLTLRETLIRELGFKEFYRTLVAPWKGTVSIPGDSGEESFYPMAHLPIPLAIGLKGWTLGWQSKFDVTNPYPQDAPSVWNKFTFPSTSFKEGSKDLGLPLMSYIKIEPPQLGLLHDAWLSQANRWVRNYPGGCTQRWGLVDMITCSVVFDREFNHSFSPNGTVSEAHLFVCPLQFLISVRDNRYTLAPSDFSPYFWASGPAGTKLLAPDECDNLGLPRLKLSFQSWGTFWEPYHYSAIQEFHQAKGFDPESLDVTRLLRLPIAQDM